mgnify:FL=1
MEFPDLGKQCSVQTCKQLDFLPFDCGACQRTFCKEHRTQTSHQCTGPQIIEDKQAPTCPLCSKPVAILPRQDVDQALAQHMHGGCKSIEQERRKQNRCCAPRCRQHELTPIRCLQCKLQFCVKHRHPADHSCDPTTAKRRLLAKPEMHRSMLDDARLLPNPNTASCFCIIS